MKPVDLAQLIVRGNYINISKEKDFITTSPIYRFTNELINEYFNHLKDRKNILSVIGSGGQILNSVLAGCRYCDCFDISIFPEYYLFLQIASIIALDKEDYLNYYFSLDKDELFGDKYYDKIRENLKGKYKKFWDSLYNFNDGIEIYDSLLFRHDTCLKHFVLGSNPYLQNDNYYKLKNILKMEWVNINPMVCNIIDTRFYKEYDLVNLSNILSYYFKYDKINDYISYLENNFSLFDNGEIINYFFNLNPDVYDKFNKLLDSNGYIEDISDNKLLVYKK